MNRLLETKPRYLAYLLGAVGLGMFLAGAKLQLAVIGNVRKDYQAQKAIANQLNVALRQDTAESRCFSDDPAVRVLSAQPAERFLRSQLLPPPATASREAFDRYIHEQGVTMLVFIRVEDSLPAKFHPELGRATDSFTPGFTLVKMQRSSFGPDVWLYRLQPPPSASTRADERRNLMFRPKQPEPLPGAQSAPGMDCNSRS